MQSFTISSASLEFPKLHGKKSDKYKRKSLATSEQNAHDPLLFSVHKNIIIPPIVPPTYQHKTYRYQECHRSPGPSRETLQDSPRIEFPQAHSSPFLPNLIILKWCSSAVGEALKTRVAFTTRSKIFLNEEPHCGGDVVICSLFLYYFSLSFRL